LNCIGKSVNGTTCDAAAGDAAGGVTVGAEHPPYLLACLLDPAGRAGLVDVDEEVQLDGLDVAPLSRRRT
jgi:hypothetical protein